MSEYRTLVKKNQDEVQSTRDEVEFVEKLGKYKMKRDPRASPDYNERTKICKKSYPDPSGKLKPDEFPFILTDLVICGLGQTCCGEIDIDKDGNEIEQTNCCNK